MKEFRLYCGLPDGKDYSDVQSWLKDESAKQDLQGNSLVRADGMWKGDSEKSFILEFTGGAEMQGNVESVGKDYLIWAKQEQVNFTVKDIESKEIRGGHADSHYLRQFRIIVDDFVSKQFRIIEEQQKEIDDLKSQLSNLMDDLGGLPVTCLKCRWVQKHNELFIYKCEVCGSAEFEYLDDLPPEERETILKLTGWTG